MSVLPPTLAPSEGQLEPKSFQIGERTYFPELVFGNDTEGTTPAIYNVTRGRLDTRICHIDGTSGFPLSRLAAGLPERCVIIIAQMPAYTVIAVNKERTFVLVKISLPGGASKYWRFFGSPAFVSRRLKVPAGQLFEPVSGEDVLGILTTDDGELTCSLPKEEFSSIDEVWAWVQKERRNKWQRSTFST